MERTDQAQADRMSRRSFMRWMAAGVLLPSMAGLAAACAPAAQPSPTAAPAKPAESKPAEAKPTEAEKPASLDQIVDGAKKEGELHWADAAVLQFNDPKFHDAFKKKYGLPDSFQVRHTLKGTGDLVTQ